MDSEVTLVDLPPPKSYFLSSTDLRDAYIYAQPGVPLYGITSDTKHIKIRDGVNANRVIAILHHRDLLPDTITFPHRHGHSSADTMSIQKWLKRSKLPDGTPMFAVDTEYGRYIWKSDSRYRHKVFADHDLENPVAVCHLHGSLPPGKPAFILHPTGEPLRDDIVVAYLIQRHRVMMENKALDLILSSVLKLPLDGGHY